MRGIGFTRPGGYEGRKGERVDKRLYIITHVEGQTGVNLERYRTDFTKQWERPGEIIVEYKEIPKSLWRRVELLAARENARIRIESVGVWGKMIACRE